MDIKDLLEAAQQLSTSELEYLVAQVLALQATRRAPHLSAEETALLLKINRGLPEDMQARFDVLNQRRQNGMLSPEEQADLTRIAEYAEQMAAQRVVYLGQLAKLRGVPVRELMQQLGIPRAVYV
ncbi:MAG: STAS/SEC14 domain-containing protein [Chloroflexaceae bacterium]|nr:STAS/SEC14 domain-containing protein [Chloroflexaceae bacterium]